METDGHNGPTTAYQSADDRRNQQVDNAIRAIQQKKPVPEIDFTIHTMEDGTQVSTLERVCKGSCEGSMMAILYNSPVANQTVCDSRCPGTCHV